MHLFLIYLSENTRYWLKLKFISLISQRAVRRVILVMFKLFLGTKWRKNLLMDTDYMYYKSAWNSQQQFVVLLPLWSREMVPLVAWYLQRDLASSRVFHRTWILCYCSTINFHVMRIKCGLSQTEKGKYFGPFRLECVACHWRPCQFEKQSWSHSQI